MTNAPVSRFGGTTLQLLLAILVSLSLMHCSEKAPETPQGKSADAQGATTTASTSSQASLSVSDTPQNGAQAISTNSPAVSQGVATQQPVAGQGKQNEQMPEAVQNVSANTPSSQVSESVTPSPTAGASATDHSAFNELLAKAVRGGRIDYAAFKGNSSFDTYLNQLATTDVSSLSTNDKLAFWVNAYNACVIKNVLNNPGLKKPTDVAGFFDKKKFAVAGKQLTLNQIENDIVRPQFKEPLIHFGLVCAAVSCPAIVPKAYTGATVRSMLADNARNYLASSQNKYDAATNTLSLSKIFDWYKDDFGGNNAGLVAFAKKYGTSAMKEGLSSEAAAASATINFLEYNWALNSR